MSVFHVSRTRTLLATPVGATTCSPAFNGTCLSQFGDQGRNRRNHCPYFRNINPGLFEHAPDRTEVVLHVHDHNCSSARCYLYRNRSCGNEHTIGNLSRIHLRIEPVLGQTEGFRRHGMRRHRYIDGPV